MNKTGKRVAVGTMVLILAAWGTVATSGDFRHSAIKAAVKHHVAERPVTAFRQAVPTPSATSCTVYAYGHDARITFSGTDASLFCSRFIKNFSSPYGNYWDSAYSAPQENGLSVVCSLTDAGITATVNDDGEQDIGQSVCSSLVQDGWTETDATSQSATSSQPSSNSSGITPGPTPGSYYVNCSIDQCTTEPGAGPYGTTCTEPSTDEQLCQ
jgi:hypothetical protein